MGSYASVNHFQFLQPTRVNANNQSLPAIAVGPMLGAEWIEQELPAQPDKLNIRPQLESVRHDIRKMFSQVSKIHEKKYGVLPKRFGDGFTPDPAARDRLLP